LHLVSLDGITHGDEIIAAEEAEDDRLDSMIKLEPERAHAKKFCCQGDNATHFIEVVIPFVPLPVV